MATVTGNLRDITGSTLNNRAGVIVFTLNAGNVRVATGGLRPDSSFEVTPESDGSFSVSLEPTTGMFLDAWYTVSIHWLQQAVGGQTQPAALQSFVDVRIRVPGSGGRIEELLDRSPGPGGTPGPNGRIVWVSQTPPPNPRPWMLWLEQEPGPDPDPFDSRNTSDLHEWRP